MDRDRKFLDLAAAAAEKSIRRGAGGPFGAVIAKGDRVLAVATNSVLSSHDPTAHAEVNAVRAATRRRRRHLLEGTTIYSTTEPCPMCFSAIHWARIARVVFATSISDVRKLGFNELTVSNRSMKSLGGSPVRLKRTPNASCRRLLRSWAAMPGRRVY